MLKIHKKILLDEDQKPFAVQIPIREFNAIEETIENFGLAKLISEFENEEILSLDDAKNYYKSIKNNVGNKI
jgi:hypothetical protein